MVFGMTVTVFAAGPGMGPGRPQQPMGDNAALFIVMIVVALSAVAFLVTSLTKKKKPNDK